MKKFALTLIVLIASAMSFFTIEFITRNFIETDIKKYEHWNRTTDKILLEEFNEILPNKDEFFVFLEDYYYCFNQGVVLDPNFMIYATFDYRSEKCFNEQLSEIEEKAKNIVKIKNIDYLIVQGDKDKIDSYLDNKIYDGYFYNFEIAIVNKEKYEISYLVSRVWDYYEYDKLNMLLKNLTQSGNNIWNS